jgi:hypothetical protein
MENIGRNGSWMRLTTNSGPKPDEVRNLVSLASAWVEEQEGLVLRGGTARICTPPAP